MAGGIYVALSGMRTRSEQLDRLAADIANAATAGYKAERSGAAAVNRPFAAILDSAVDTAPLPGRIDFRPGVIAGTGRDLDVALDGRGFFAVETPAGPRYTRNGHFEKKADGTLVTGDGMTVLGEKGPIKLGGGPVAVLSDGTVTAGGVAAGKLQVVDFDDYQGLGREEGGRFRASAGMTPKAVVQGLVRGGALEQANVSVVERMASLSEVSRGFEALQRGVTLMANDIDARAISELGRR
jgi:flagellar basal body rod protein FlgG